MVCCTPSGVMGVNFVNIKEVFRQVQGYLGGVTDLVDQTHSKMLELSYMEPVEILRFIENALA